MKNLFNRFVREEQGQDLIEYALLAGLISIASVVGHRHRRHCAQHQVRRDRTYRHGRVVVGEA